MESTAQYWKLVWQELEGACELFLAQAYSSRRLEVASGILPMPSAC